MLSDGLPVIVIQWDKNIVSYWIIRVYFFKIINIDRSVNAYVYLDMSVFELLIDDISIWLIEIDINNISFDRYFILNTLSVMKNNPFGTKMNELAFVTYKFYCFRILLNDNPFTILYKFN